MPHNTLYILFLNNYVDNDLQDVFYIYRSNCDRLDVLVSKVPAVGARRENWKTKVDQMKADVRSLQSDFTSLQGNLVKKALHKTQKHKKGNMLLFRYQDETGVSREN